MRLIREQHTGRLSASLRGLLPAVGTLLLFLGGITVLGPAVELVTANGSNTEVVLASLVQGALYIVLISVAIWSAAKLERRTYRNVWTTVDRDWIRNFTVGIAITLLGVSVSLGWAGIRGIRDVNLGAAEITGPDNVLLIVVVFSLFGWHFLLGNIYEELIYRRILLGNFVEGLTTRGVSPPIAIIPATIVSLLLFGAYHVPLRGNFVVALDAALDGIPFVVAFLLTGRLALPVGLHFGRISVEFLHGLSRGEFGVVPLVEITQNTLLANLELKFIRIALICLCILTWVYLNQGTIQVADTVYEEHDEQADFDDYGDSDIE